MGGFYSWNASLSKPSLDGPLRKIDRAEAQIKGLQTASSSFLSSCGYQTREEFAGDPPFLHVIIEKANFPPVPAEFSLVAGEVIYQLRTALDHLIFQLIRANGENPSRKNSWPILGPNSKKEFDPKVWGVTRSARELIEPYQPYHDGELYRQHPLWRLRALNDWDKHNFVVRTFLAQPGGIEIRWVDQTGRDRFVQQHKTGPIEPDDVFSFVGPALQLQPGTDLKVHS